MRRAALVLAVGFALLPASAEARSCTVNDARLGYTGNQGAAGTQFENFRYTKVGGGSCALKGFPKVALLTKTGRVVSIKVRRSHKYPVKPVGLRKGKAVSWEITHPSFDRKTTKPCKTRVWGFRVKTPGFSKVLELKLSSPLRFCDAGAKRTAFHR